MMILWTEDLIERHPRQCGLRGRLLCKFQGTYESVNCPGEGAKMPADIGGSIYLLLRNKGDIRPIQTALQDFVEQRL